MRRFLNHPAAVNGIVNFIQGGRPQPQMLSIADADSYYLPI
jgi:hypothetical protein